MMKKLVWTLSAVLVTNVALSSGAVAGNKSGGKVTGTVVVMAGNRGMMCVDDSGKTVADASGNWSTTKPAAEGNACKAGSKKGINEAGFKGIQENGIK
jgi:hypothetical protein